MNSIGQVVAVATAVNVAVGITVVLVDGIEVALGGTTVTLGVTGSRSAE